MGNHLSYNCPGRLVDLMNLYAGASPQEKLGDHQKKLFCKKH